MINFTFNLKMHPVKKTYGILFYTLLLAVYGAFFSVQFFFNFEAFPNSQDLISHCRLLPGSPKVNIQSKTTPTPASARHSIRLNKRFQQEDMPPCHIVSIVIPQRYIPLRTPDWYKSVRWTSFIPSNPPLRGPPSAA